MSPNATRGLILTIAAASAGFVETPDETVLKAHGHLDVQHRRRDAYI
jgi:hypothetical protein